MPGFSLLLLQAATAVASQPAADERLLHPAPPPRCQPSSHEIVVCGTDRNDAYRLHAVGPEIEPTGTLPKAEWRLFGNTRMSVHGEQRSVGGFSAPAAMATITVPF